jgi:hypothetical protein
MSERNVIAVACAAAAIAWAPCASAELYKCVGADGKTVFSDTRCEGMAPAPAKKVETDKAAKGPSEDDRARLKTLDAITVDHKATDEQKTGAQLEAAYIRRNLEGTLTAAEKERRAALTKELASPDANKRAAALRELRTLYRE